MSTSGVQILEKILIQLEHQTDELDTICTRLDTMKDIFNADKSSSNGTSGNGMPVSKDQDGNLVEFDATEIVTTFDDSGTRKLFRIKGGQFSTYGLRVWDEVLQKFGYDPKDLEPGSTPFTERVLPDRFCMRLPPMVSRWLFKARERCYPHPTGRFIMYL